MMLEDSRAPGKVTGFLVILISFLALDLLSWPIFFSYYLWVFADRSNFLNLDYMLAEHLHLGVDAFYQYGLLPVFIQHVLFAMFGRGYWPMIGCTIVVLILMAAFWSLFLRYVSRRWLYLLAVITVTPFLLWVNPNFPYSLVQLSMLFALLFLLEGRADAALAVSVIGCFSVPSLPLLLTGLLALYIAADWWLNSDRSISLLVRRFAPGVLTYVLLFAGLSAFFGFRSAVATAFPMLGVKFYYGLGKMDYSDLKTFLHPAGHSLKYYIAYYIVTPVTWWILSTLALIVMGVQSFVTMVRTRRPDPKYAVVAFCAALQVFFAVVAYKGDGQHIIYDPIVAAGVLLGISILATPPWQNRLLILFICVGLCAQAAQARATLTAWKETHRSPITKNLYAEPEYGPQMAKILEIASNHKVLMMSNATGVHNYYPTVGSPDTWFLMPNQQLPTDRERILADVRAAEVVVEDTTHVPYFTDRDPDVQAELRSMCLTDVTRDFQIWWRHPLESAACKVNMRNTRSGPQ
ncbi:hypothetical protein [Tunturiibacter gelidiferens]|uniref:Glycosyltransferase RgtA/B/C/D-like domain-containing protein n=1 Tax=Tunturiibacter gelidiferens TaxID=3069689 RepID=A0AAU7Z3F3_9BACT